LDIDAIFAVPPRSPRSHEARTAKVRHSKMMLFLGA